MRIPALFLPLLLLCGGCSLFSSESQSEFTPPNSLMADEIETRVQQIPFQHRDELLQNLLWLTQTGESTIPALLRGLRHESPKVRSSCAWALGRIHDRRTIQYLQPVAKDSNETVRLEAARSLVLLGDLKQAPVLIEGLDSQKKEVRFLCHEALKASTGRDFGFDHLSDNETQRRVAVLGWRQWWSEYSGDSFFASSYSQRYQLNQPAQPMGETQPMQDPLYQDPMDQHLQQQGQPMSPPMGDPMADPMGQPMGQPNGQSSNQSNNPNGQTDPDGQDGQPIDDGVEVVPPMPSPSHDGNPDGNHDGGNDGGRDGETGAEPMPHDGDAGDGGR